MVRKIIIPDNKKISITLPEDFVGKQVQVIAFTIDDEELIVESLNDDITTTHFASSEVLAKDWLSSVEDKAWQDL